MWDLENKKCIQSNNVTFFEDQIIDDIEKTDKSTFSVNIPVNLDLIPSPVLYDGHQDPKHTNIHIGDM